MFYTYVLRSQKNGWFYVGATDDVERRLLLHNQGKTKSTKGHIPWEVFFYEEFRTFDDALKRERYLKSGVGKEYIKRKWRNRGER